MKRWDWTRRLLLGSFGTVSVLGVSDQWGGSSFAVAASGKHRHARATRSSPIAITSDDRFVWSVNPDNNSVSVFNVAGDANMKIAEIPVGSEPWCVAITPDDARCTSPTWRAARSRSSTLDSKVVDTIKVGTEPFGCALTPDGTKLYVANQSSDDRLRDRHRDATGRQDHRGVGAEAARHRRSPRTATRSTSRSSSR